MRLRTHYKIIIKILNLNNFGTLIKQKGKKKR